MAGLQSLRKCIIPWLKRKGSSHSNEANPTITTTGLVHTNNNQKKVESEQLRIASQARIVELTRELGSLQENIAHQQALIKVLTRFLLFLKMHGDGLMAAARECDELIMRANDQWQKE